MGVITISLEENVEETLRRLAHEKYHGKKGGMAKVLEEGIREVERKMRSEAAKVRFMARAAKGFDLGGKGFERKKFYEEMMDERFGSKT